MRAVMCSLLLAACSSPKPSSQPTASPFGVATPERRAAWITSCASQVETTTDGFGSRFYCKENQDPSNAWKVEVRNDGMIGRIDFWAHSQRDLRARVRRLLPSFAGSAANTLLATSDHGGNGSVQIENVEVDVHRYDQADLVWIWWAPIIGY